MAAPYKYGAAWPFSPFPPGLGDRQPVPTRFKDDDEGCFSDNSQSDAGSDGGADTEPIAIDGFDDQTTQINQARQWLLSQPVDLRICTCLVYMSNRCSVSHAL